MQLRLATAHSFLLLLSVSSFLLTPCASADPNPGNVVPGEVLVGLRARQHGDRGIGDIARLVGRVSARLRAINAWRIQLGAGLSVESALVRLRPRQEVVWAEANRYVAAQTVPNDPSYSQQYGPQITQADRSWDIWQPQSQVVVAIVDTGIDWNHPDLTDVIYRDGTGAPIAWNVQANSSNALDDNGHGTHCAGIAAAHINNGTGIAGVAGWSTIVPGSDSYIRVMPVKALDQYGNGTDADIASGILWAVSNGAKVISLSVGSTTPTTTLDNAVQYAWNQGALIVAAAGNGASNIPFYPAAYPNVLSVAATDSTDTLTGFTEYGSWVMAAAPGQNILSTWPGGSYASQSGTSMSCPHVAGEAAAILSQNPILTNAEVSNLICCLVDPCAPWQNQSISWWGGRINIFRAIAAAGTGIASLTSVAVNPSYVAGSVTARGSVFLGGRAASGGSLVTLSSSDSTIASVPGSVIVPEGATSVTFDVLTGQVSGQSSAVITATLDTGTATCTVTVRPPQLIAFDVSPSLVSGGTPVTGTVTLDGPAPSGGANVTVTSTSSAAAVTAPPVVVPEGQTVYSFAISTFPVAKSTPVTLLAAYDGGGASAALTVKSPGVSSVTLAPTSVVGGTASAGTVNLSGPAPAGGLGVTLSCSKPNVAQTPASLVIPAGQTSASFAITTSAVAANTNVTIHGTANGVTQSATLTVKPLLSSLTLSPSSVTGGAPATGTITLNVPAGSGGATVQLSSGNTTAATVPASATVPEGSLSVTFPVTTLPVASNTSALISASLAGVVRTANVTVKAAALTSVTLSPSSVIGGTSSTATINLSGPAPAGGLQAQVASSNPSAQTPASVVIPEGATSASFQVTTGAVASNTSTNISATANGVMKSATLTIKPAQFTSITLSPNSVKGGLPSTATITLNGPAPTNGITFLATSSNKQAAQVPTAVTVPGGATSVTFTVTTSTVAANTSVTISATGLNVKRSATLTITP